MTLTMVAAEQTRARYPDDEGFVERVAGLVDIGPALRLGEAEHGEYPFDSDPGTDEGWAKETRAYWERDWPGYLEFFFAECLTEPHSTKQIEDGVGWGLDTDMETILAGFRGWETKIIDPAEVGAAWRASSGAGSSCWKGQGTPPTPATRSR